MKPLLTILLITCIVLPISGTGQPCDIFIWQDDTLITYHRLLESYPDWKILQNKISATLERNDRQIHPEKYVSDEIEFSNYVAEWRVIDNRLFLSNIYNEFNFDVKADLSEIFTVDLDNNLLFADWIIDEIECQKGNVIVPGIKPIHEYCLVLQINEGIIMDKTSYTNYVAKKPWYESSERPNCLMDMLYSKINWAKLPDFNSKRLQVIVTVQPNKKGKLKQIELSETYMIDGRNVITDPNNPFIKEAIKVARKISEWYVIYHRNSILNQSVQIIFCKENHQKYAR